MEIQLKVDGMHCDACVRRLRKALEKLQGAEILEVSVGTVRVQGPPRAEVEAAVIKAGYTVAL
jgi:copper chaperone